MNIGDIANFGESGKLALSHAERISKETRHDDIGAEQIFLGVAQLEDVNIRRQFQKAGVDIDEVSRSIRSGIKAGETAAGLQLMLSADAKKAVEAAKQEARSLGQDKVEAPHLLLGLLEDEDGRVGSGSEECRRRAGQGGREPAGDAAQGRVAAGIL